jgi:hypothetical protein
MNYKISFPEMDRLASQANLKKSRLSLEQMRAQVSQLKNSSTLKVKKQQR